MSTTFILHVIQSLTDINNNSTNVCNWQGTLQNTYWWNITTSPFVSSPKLTITCRYTWCGRGSWRLRTSGHIEHLLHPIQVQRLWPIRPLGVSVEVPSLTDRVLPRLALIPAHAVLVSVVHRVVHGSRVGLTGRREIAVIDCFIQLHCRQVRDTFHGCLSIYRSINSICGWWALWDWSLLRVSTELIFRRTLTIK